MIEHYELRLAERYARLIFRADEGEIFPPGITRKVLIAPDDPRIPRIVELDESLRRKHEPFLGGTRVVRKYTAAEMKSADVLTYSIGFFIEPAVSGSAVVNSRLRTLFDEWL